jgi:SAM-dependent methyltransferase
VANAVACQPSADQSEGIVAFVVAEHNYSDEVLGRTERENNQIRRWRKTYDLTQLATSTENSPFAFNIGGWKSSYTRQPLPAEDMREWVQTTVERISAFRPSEVLEIGCGTGLLLLRLAPNCERYVGVDFSPVVLTRLKEQLMRQPRETRERVEVLERSADNLVEFAENSFDTVILNSVAQYFPSQAYLNRVMESAIHVLKPGGRLFVGDVRSLTLLEAYAVSVEVFRAEPDVRAVELRKRIHERLQQEPELVLSPSYFLSLGQRFDKVSYIEISPRRGLSDNEMTRFRYDAILRTGINLQQPGEIPFIYPPGDGWRVSEIRQLLSARNSGAFGIARIRNSRVSEYVRLLSQLTSADPSKKLNEVRADADRRATDGIHPEDIFALARGVGYNAAISWAGCYSDGSYDAAFIRENVPSNAFPLIAWPGPILADFVYYANTPGASHLRKKIVDELMLHCRANLLSQLVPRTLHLVDSLPLRTECDIDCQALLCAKQKFGHFLSDSCL